MLNHAQTAPGNDNEQVLVAWSDGHHGRFSSSWLRQYRYDHSARRLRIFSPGLWTDEFRENPPTVEFSRVIGTDAAFLNLLHVLRDHGLCFVRGAPAQPGIITTLARKIGCIQENNFGLIQDLVVDQNLRSIANDTNALKPHTDEPYRASPPGLILLHCVETDMTGVGSSTFLDRFEIAEALRREDPDGFTALTRNNQAFRRHFADDVDLITEFPVISTDEFGNVCGVRVNDRVAAPACIPSGEIPVYYRGMRRLVQLAEDADRILNKTLRPGDIVVFDNHRILQGRTQLTFKGRRWLQWVQVERGDFYSTMRVMADKLNLHRDALPLLRGAYG